MAGSEFSFPKIARVSRRYPGLTSILPEPVGKTQSDARKMTKWKAE